MRVVRQSLPALVALYEEEKEHTLLIKYPTDITAHIRHTGVSDAHNYHTSNVGSANVLFHPP